MEILEADRVCPTCHRTPAFDGEPIGDDRCHVCGGPGEPLSYWRALAGRELPDEGQAASWVAVAAREAGSHEGRIDEHGFARFCATAGIQPEEAAEWRDAIGVFLIAELSGSRYAEWERGEEMRKTANGTGKKRGRR